MKGRKPKPTALKLVQGNPGKRAINHDEPQAALDLPKPPAYLSATSKAAFKELAQQLHDAKVLTNLDRKALTVLCNCYGEWRELNELIKANGYSYTTISTAGEPVEKARPEVAMRADAEKRLRAWLAEFGLTPSARSRVKVEKDQDADPLAAFMAQ